MPRHTRGSQASRLMRRRILVILVLLALAGFAGFGALRTWPPPRSGTMLNAPDRVHRPTTRSFRIATFNIHSCVGADDRMDIDRVASSLRGFDVVGLNEVRGSAPWRWDNQARLLGDRLSLPWLFVPSERQWYCDSFGNALLCARPVQQWHHQPMAGSFWRGKRSLLRATFLVGDRPVRLIVTHLDRHDDRARQLTNLGQLFLTEPAPVVFMGDLNTPADDPLIAWLLSKGADDPVGKVLGAHCPKDRIDWILTRGLRCRDAGLIDNGASDHPMPWAELEIQR